VHAGVLKVFVFVYVNKCCLVYRAGGDVDITSTYIYCLRSLLPTVHSHTSNVPVSHVKGWLTQAVYSYIGAGLIVSKMCMYLLKQQFKR